MIKGIELEAERRGITRLCHFTPSRNLAHIAADKMGILCTKSLSENERRVYNPTDLQRLDRHDRYVCCSIEYPNAWYLDLARARDKLFRDWVIIFINRRYLWAPGTKFCNRNAAAAYGRKVGEGEAAFSAMFAESVQGAGGRTYVRTPNHLPCCPTDEQAEVLIPDAVSTSDIVGVAVMDETQAKNEVARLRLMAAVEHKFKFVIVPDLFDKRALSDIIRRGRPVVEREWDPRRET